MTKLPTTLPTSNLYDTKKTAPEVVVYHDYILAFNMNLKMQLNIPLNTHT